MNRLRAASVQFNHAPGDKERNFSLIEAFVEKAASQKVELIVFPEMCITGYWHVRKLKRPEVEALAEPVPDGPSTRRLLDLAERHRMTVCAGLVEEAADGKLYNAYVIAMPGGRTVVHRKLHAFENDCISSGDAYTVFELPDGTRAGVLICYDCNIGENVRITTLMGAEILIAPHQTGGCRPPNPRCMGGIDLELWRRRKEDPEAIEAEFKGPKGRAWLLRWLPARAHDNGIFILFSNGVGIDDDEVRTGNAMILDPYGEILAETWQADDAMVIADLDPVLIDGATGRRWIRTRRPELYSLLSKRTGNEEDTRKVRFEEQPQDLG